MSEHARMTIAIRLAEVAHCINLCCARCVSEPMRPHRRYYWHDEYWHGESEAQNASGEPCRAPTALHHRYEELAALGAKLAAPSAPALDTVR